LHLVGSPSHPAMGSRGGGRVQSSNPIFPRSEQFNSRSSGYSNPRSLRPALPCALDPRGTRTAGSGHDVGHTPPPPTTYADRMTIDSVVQRTAITLTLVVIAAAATWFFIGDMVEGAQLNADKVAMANTLAFGGAIVGLGLALVNSFKKVISPALVIAYALVEGVFIGAFSKTIAVWVGDPGIVFGAVLGTVGAFAGTLAAYKILDIKVTNKFRKYVVAAIFGFVGMAVLDMVLSMFGASFGFNGFGTLGLITSVIGVGLGVLMLILDFDYVERGIAAGLPERESWRAAFGLTVTLIWIYIEMLRILAILRGGE